MAVFQELDSTDRFQCKENSKCSHIWEWSLPVENIQKTKTCNLGEEELPDLDLKKSRFWLN